MGKRILVVDDEEIIRYSLSLKLKREGYDTVSEASGEGAVQRARREKFALAILDVVMPDMDGMETFKQIREVDPTIAVIMLSGKAAIDKAVESMKMGACDYITKPVGAAAALNLRIVRAIEKNDLIVRNRQLVAELRQANTELEKRYRELRETQDRLIQSEKMVTVGHLASGFAHEIRNPLTVILQGVDVVREALPEQDAMLLGSMEMIKRAAQRANRIIVDLLRYSRASEMDLKPVYVSEVLDEAVGLIARRAELNNVRIRRSYGDDPIQIKADINMLQQTFLNLFTNALDAISEAGELRITTSLNEKVESRVRIEVEDTGRGIPKPELSRIFDAFYTTKDPGKGTGLGLSIAHMIIERHNGTITVESDPNSGTRFTIELPVISVPESAVLKGDVRGCH